jgi:hypothetical protein
MVAQKVAADAHSVNSCGMELVWDAQEGMEGRTRNPATKVSDEKVVVTFGRDGHTRHQAKPKREEVRHIPELGINSRMRHVQR